VTENVVSGYNAGQEMGRIAKVSIYNAIPDFVPFVLGAGDELKRSIVLSFNGNDVAGLEFDVFNPVSRQGDCEGGVSDTLHFASFQNPAPENIV